MNTSVGALKPTIVTTQLKSNVAIETTNTYVSAVVAMVVMDPYKVEPFMRLNATKSLNGLSSKADALIDKTASLNIVMSKDFLWPMVYIKIIRLLLS
jgi:hypothetical protein